MKLKNFNLKIAGRNKSFMNLSAPHCSSFEFGQCRPTYYRDLIPGDKISVNLDMIVRTAPMTYPAFGACNFYHRAFFVPYRLVMKNFANLYTQEYTISSKGVPFLPTSPMMDAETFLSAFFMNPNNSETPAPYLSDENGLMKNAFVEIVARKDDGVPPTDKAWDGAITYTANPQDALETLFYKFTPFGKYVIKVMNSLGYDINFPSVSRAAYQNYLSSHSNFTGPLWNTHFVKPFNMLALLCYMRCILDNYVPSALVPSHPLSELLARINAQFESGTVNNFIVMFTGDQSEKEFNYSDIVNMFKQGFQVFSGSGYFTTAWYQQNSVLPLQSSISVNSEPQINLLNRGEDEASQIASGGDIYTYSSSREGLSWLRAVGNWFIRKNWAGSRATEQFLAKFGIRVPNSRLDYSEYIDTYVDELTIFDITQGASTEQGTLGEYAGKGYAVHELNKSKPIEYEAEEFGLFIIMTSLCPHGGFVQGIDRERLVKDWTEYYQPEFEKVGNDAIAIGELYKGMTSTDPLDNTQDTVNTSEYDCLKAFGYLPRGAHRKFPRAFLTGDFQIRSCGGMVDGELQGYHSFRLLGKPSQNPDPDAVYQKVWEPIAQHDTILFDNGHQYDRMFNVQDPSVDHLHGYLNWKVSLYTTQCPLDESVDLDGFREVTIQPNGKALN